jgi:hypothetical protein
MSLSANLSGLFSGVEKRYQPLRRVRGVLDGFSISGGAYKGHNYNDVPDDEHSKAFQDEMIGLYLNVLLAFSSLVHFVLGFIIH